MMDVTLAAVEEQWSIAQANAGRPMETAALQRAQILATLLGNGIRQNGGRDFWIADDAPFETRVEAAAEILGWEPATLSAALGYLEQNVTPQDDPEPAAVIAEPEPDDDFFAEVRAEARR